MSAYLRSEIRKFQTFYYFAYSHNNGNIKDYNKWKYVYRFALGSFKINIFSCIEIELKYRENI